MDQDAAAVTSTRLRACAQRRQYLRQQARRNPGMAFGCEMNAVPGVILTRISGSNTITRMLRARSRLAMAAMLAERCSREPRKRRSLPPGCRIAMRVPFGTASSRRPSMPPVVSKGRPALMTWAATPPWPAAWPAAASVKRCHCATPQPDVLLAPTATIVIGSRGASTAAAHIASSPAIASPRPEHGVPPARGELREIPTGAQAAR